MDESLLPVLSEVLSPAELKRAMADPQDVEYRRWQIEDLRGADWAMRKLAAAKAYIAEAQHAADLWTAEIDDWYRRTTVKAASTVAYMEAALVEYALGRRDETGEKRLALPGGEVQTVESQPRVVVSDEDAAIKWAEESGHWEAVQLRKSFLVSKIRDAVKVVTWIDEDGETYAVVDVATGEFVPGLDVVPGRVSGSVVVR